MSRKQEHQAALMSAPAAVGVPAAVPQHLDGAGAPAASPRTVTTGGKVASGGPGHARPGLDQVDPTTGERFEASFISRRHGFKITRHLTPEPAAAASVAQIDALSFTVLPPEGQSFRWLMEQMSSFVPIDQVQSRNGCFGFKQSARFGGGAGLIAWGGASQRGRVYFSIQGIGCSTVNDWPGLATWLREHHATLKRVDVAYDDFAGETVSIEWAKEQYRGDGFNAGGRKPRHQVFGDWLDSSGSAAGRTIGIGNRASGKYCRIYEKGKQLGNPFSPWTRIEVEWHSKDRLLPFELLTEPGKYLAGAYPCLAFLHVEQLRIKTIANAASISLEASMDNARQQNGKLLNLMLGVYGGDYVAVVERLRRRGIPGRIEPYQRHLAGSPELLDRDAPGSFAARGLVE